MKIRIKGEERGFTILLPTGLVFSRPSVWLWLKIARKASKEFNKYLPEHVEEKTDDFLMKIPDEAMYALCVEIMRIKKKYGSWDLVEVESASGECVKITL